MSAVPERFDTYYLTCAYDLANHWIHSNWKGYQTLESVQAGGAALLQLVEQHQCAYLLNDNRRVLGMWNTAMDWTVSTWTPDMVAQGLTHFAHIVHPDAMVTISAEALTRGVTPYVHFALFEDIAPAQTWLHQAQLAAICAGAPHTLTKLVGEEVVL